MIRLAVLEDFTSIMSIYAYARSFMQETGNPNQWGNHFPPEELRRRAAVFVYLLRAQDRRDRRGAARSLP